MLRITTTKPIFCFLVAFGCLLTAGCSDSPVSDEDPDPEPVPTEMIPVESTARSIAFIDVNVIPMDREVVLSEHTVLVQDGEISAVGPSGTITLPPDVVRIPATDLFLMPGLADMHVHMTTTIPDGENDLFLYVANGVTTVRVMEGSPTVLGWRDEVAAGTRVGPTMLVASRPLDGADSGNRVLITTPRNIATAEEGREAVREYVSDGYDYIKIYNTLELDVYNAIMDEAASMNIKAIGHIPVDVSMEQAIAAGQHSTEHLNPFARSVIELSGMGRFEGMFDATRAAEGAAAIAASGMWNCPTLAFYQRSLVPGSETDPNLRYVSPSLQFDFQPTASQPTTPANTRNMTRALHDAGAPIILGTWTGTRFLMPGFSVVDELTALSSAGLSAFEALQTATVNAALSAEEKGNFGTVTVGKRADLVLLDGNPLDRLRNVERIAGVMVKGHWYSEDRLDERLEEIAVSYGR